MAHVEAVLKYRSDRSGKDAQSVSIGRTSDPRVLRAVRDQLLTEAATEADSWANVDPALAELMAAEAERLTRILEFLLPDDEFRTGPELVEDDC